MEPMAAIRHADVDPAREHADVVAGSRSARPAANRAMISDPVPPGASSTSPGIGGVYRLLWTELYGRRSALGGLVARPADLPFLWASPGPAWPWMPWAKDSQSRRLGAGPPMGTRARAGTIAGHGDPGAGHRQLRLVRLQPRARAGRAGRRPGGLPQRRHRRRRDPRRGTRRRPDLAGARAPRGRRDQPGGDRGSWPGRSRSSACASATSASARRSAARWSPPRPSCTARPRRSTTTGPGSSPGCPIPSWPPATTRWWSRRPRVPAELGVTARTADGVVMGLRHPSLAVKGCSSTPSRCSPSRGRPCSRTSWPRPGLTRGGGPGARGPSVVGTTSGRVVVVVEVDGGGRRRGGGRRTVVVVVGGAVRTTRRG